MTSHQAPTYGTCYGDGPDSLTEHESLDAAREAARQIIADGLAREVDIVELEGSGPFLAHDGDEIAPTHAPRRTVETIRESPAITARRSACEECGEAGVHVDTDAGEIVSGGDVVASVAGETVLMVDERGRLLCDDCAGEPGEDPRAALLGAIGGARRTTVEIDGQYREIVTDLDAIDPAGALTGQAAVAARRDPDYVAAITETLDAYHAWGVARAEGQVGDTEAADIPWLESDLSDDALRASAEEVRATLLAAELARYACRECGASPRGGSHPEDHMFCPEHPAAIIDGPILRTVQCECGTITGERCEWSGPAGETTLIEWMPEHLRASHTAAGNAGQWPHNGAVRLRVETGDCLDRMTLDPWVRIVAPQHATDADCNVDAATDTCRTCGVLHGDPCPSCGGRAFHRDGCA